MANKGNYNATWIAARKNGQTLQAIIMCTWARIYAPVYYEKKYTPITSLFNLQKEIEGDYTVIQDDFIAELTWMDGLHDNTPWGTIYGKKNSISSYNSLLGDKNFFNPNTLHVGRLTDYAISCLIRKVDNQQIRQQITDNPYILYRPSQWHWIQQVETNNEDYKPNTPDSSTKSMSNSSALLFGAAASLFMLQQ